MRRFAILSAAVTACLLFTACPNKPIDDPVVIPDGIYEETAHSQYRYVLEHIIYSHDTVRDTVGRIFRDSVFTTQVIISQGDFIYPDMCRDTSRILLGKYVYYADHFIYNATHYCWDDSVPARTEDGYVILKSPRFSQFSIGFLPGYDTSFVYRARVSRTEDGYTFRHVHHFTEYDDSYYGHDSYWSYAYEASHTLRPL